MKITEDTTFALVTDIAYLEKTKKTILDLRSIGKWNGNIVVYTIDFHLNHNFKDLYNIIEVKFPIIEKDILLIKQFI